MTTETPCVRRHQHADRPGNIGGTREHHMANAFRLAEISNGNIREQQHPNQWVQKKPQRDDQVLRGRNKIVLRHKTDDRLQSGPGKITIIEHYVRKNYDNEDIKKYLNDENVENNKVETLSHSD